MSDRRTEMDQDGPAIVSRARWLGAAGALLAAMGGTSALAAPPTAEAPMLRGDTPATGNGWTVTPVFTVSESITGYQAPGILDGMAAYDRSNSKVRVLVSHELNPGNGYPYTLENGTQLTGARVSFFDFNRFNRRITKAGPAYRTVYDRGGNVVTDPAQINETDNGIDGFARFCSAQGVQAGQYGFVDDIYLCGEETSKPFHPHGGTEWALDVEGGAIWAIPAVGRGAWENVTPLATGSPGTVALLLGDDKESAPLYLYVGEKNALGDGSFLDRNGLAVGQLHAWRADTGDLSPETFNGEQSVRTGTWVPIDVRDVSMAGQDGYDAQGYLDGDTLRQQADDDGCFSFSRPEDVHTNPYDGTQAVFASTGRGGLFPSDNWGIIYRVDVSFADMTGTLTIIHDADDRAVPDTGIRSPDNLTWAENGLIYVQEDRSTSPSSLFGAATGIEASLWQLDPWTGAIVRIAEIDRTAVAPAGSTDSGAGDIGNWESSGVIDVTSFFLTAPGETLLLANVQAHGVRDGLIGDNPLLDEGGQIVFVSDAH
ncbi:MAG: alkaline phosphatase PhoX [Planctomycetota bacterium]|jgi:hypothetical protein